METIKKENGKQQEFIYSCSKILQIIYDAYRDNLIGQKEKLKLKSLIMRKSKIIEELMYQYESNQAIIDWDSIKKKLNVLKIDKDSENDIEDSKEKLRRNFPETKKSKKKSIKHINNYQTIHYSEKKDFYYNKQNYKNIYKLSKKIYFIKDSEDLSKKIELEEIYNQKIIRHDIDNSKKNNFDNLNKNLKIIFDVPGIILNYSKTDTKIKDFSLLFNPHQIVNKNEIIDFPEIDIKDESILILKNYNDSRFFSDEEEMKNLSTTAGMENMFLDSLSNHRLNERNIKTNSSKDQKNSEIKNESNIILENIKKPKRKHKSSKDCDKISKITQFINNNLPIKRKKFEILNQIKNTITNFSKKNYDTDLN